MGNVSMYFPMAILIEFNINVSGKHSNWYTHYFHGLMYIYNQTTLTTQLNLNTRIANNLKNIEAMERTQREV